MANGTLAILRKGLSTLKLNTKKRKDILIARLTNKEKISAADEHWLDNAGNEVDEQQILDELEAACR